MQGSPFSLSKREKGWVIPSRSSRCIFWACPLAGRAKSPPLRGVGLLRGSQGSVSPAARPPLRGALRIPHAGAAASPRGLAAAHLHLKDLSPQIWYNPISEPSHLLPTPFFPLPGADLTPSHRMLPLSRTPDITPSYREPSFPTPFPPYQGGKGTGKGRFRIAQLYIL